MSEARLGDAIRAVKFRWEQRLGHLGEVRVMAHDHDLDVGVALFLHSRTGRWRHAVVGTSQAATEDPVGFADVAAEKLLEWVAANAEQSGSLLWAREKYEEEADWTR